MDASVFDVLTGSFAEEQPLSSVPEDRYLVRSVVSNLNRMFDTRQGTVEHLPDYGLPNMSSVYRDAPRSGEDLRRAIKESVEKYEPRLRQVRVERRETSDHSMRLVFLLRAELKTGERIRLETTFESQRPTKVEPVGAYV